jgi:hypothetical protein
MKTRVAGAVVAAAISLSLAAVPSDLVLFDGSLTTDLVGLGILGAPLAAILALWLTPAAARASWRMAAAIGLAMGIGAAYLGVLEIALLTLIGSLLGLDPTTGFGSGVTGAMFIATVGLPYGTLVLPITIPCGLAWAFVVRSLAVPIGANSPDAPSLSAM